jgi:hypothetical protein
MFHSLIDDNRYIKLLGLLWAISWKCLKLEVFIRFILSRKVCFHDGLFGWDKKGRGLTLLGGRIVQRRKFQFRSYNVERALLLIGGRRRMESFGKEVHVGRTGQKEEYDHPHPTDLVHGKEFLPRGIAELEEFNSI